MQPTTEANKACEVARYYIPPREDYFRGGFFLLIFNLFIMRKKKVLKVLAYLQFELLLLKATNEESGQPCILAQRTYEICLENCQFLEEFVSLLSKNNYGKK